MKLYRNSIKNNAREMNTMLPEMNTKGYSVNAALRFFTGAVLFMMLIVAGVQADAAVKQKLFASPEEAVKSAISAVKADNNKEVLAIFGPEAKELIYSGDAAMDKERRAKFIDAFDKKNSLTKDGEKMILVVGEKNWPFPIPLVKTGEQWFFDTKAGREEILNRRIGHNELDTIQTVLAIADAQHEYAMADHDGDGLREYAGKFMSDSGKKNGLYWDTKTGEAPSPLGELIVKAMAEGRKKGAKNSPVPYHGYYYRMLYKQGKNAQGGAFDYIVKKNQIGGFAVVAYPAKYHNSGVMTFIVNHEGVVYEKDLGKNTAVAAKAMKSFDPDKTWKKAQQDK